MYKYANMIYFVVTILILNSLQSKMHRIFCGRSATAIVQMVKLGSEESDGAQAWNEPEISGFGFLWDGSEVKYRAYWRNKLAPMAVRPGPVGHSRMGGT